VDRLEIIAANPQWLDDESLQQSPIGKPLSASLARDLMRQLLSTGRYANARCEALEADGQIVLRAIVTPRRVVARLEVEGGNIDLATVAEAAEVEAGKDITLDDLPRIEERVASLYRTRGFPEARARRP